MGYYAEQVDSDFFISAEMIPSVIEAIHSLVEKGKFSWVRDDYIDSNNVADIFRYWRWDIELDQEGNISIISFAGEKLGDDEVLFRTIAPFVKAGSFVEMVGEDHAMWRWKFDGKRMKEIYPEVVWKD